jgi:hypothetical protein
MSGLIQYTCIKKKAKINVYVEKKKYKMKRRKRCEGDEGS